MHHSSISLELGQEGTFFSPLLLFNVLLSLLAFSSEFRQQGFGSMIDMFEGWKAHKSSQYSLLIAAFAANMYLDFTMKQGHLDNQIFIKNKTSFTLCNWRIYNFLKLSFSFNDRIRDAMLGGSPFGHLLQQGFMTGLFLQVFSQLLCREACFIQSSNLRYHFVEKINVLELRRFSFYSCHYSNGWEGGISSSLDGLFVRKVYTVSILGQILFIQTYQPYKETLYKCQELVSLWPYEMLYFSFNTCMTPSSLHDL